MAEPKASRQRTRAPRARTRKPAPAPLDGGRYADYERIYGRGGFGHNPDVEQAWLDTVLLPATGWAKGTRVIELGAGDCVHAAALARLGMDVTAVEVSVAGAAKGRATYPTLDVVCADAAQWATDRPGAVFARGLSWFHYELTGTNRHGVDVPACTARVMRDLVAPGALLAVMMSTSLSGARPVDRVHHNTVADFLGLFEPLGQTTILDWSGRPIVAGQRHDRGVLALVRKPG
jgi:SAM-dependent methyltransferase